MRPPIQRLCRHMISMIAVILLSAAAGAQGGAVISQKEIGFHPRSITIPLGAEVVFRNEDPFGHNVYSPSQGGVFDIGLQEPFGETPVKFSQAGEYTIMCRIHLKMRAKVIVK